MNFVFLFGLRYPGYQRLFSRTAGIFGVGRRPKPRETPFRAGHYKDLTETGNRARKVSSTQGRIEVVFTLTTLPYRQNKLKILSQFIFSVFRP